MDIVEYFKSISLEFEGQQNRVRNFLKYNHPPTDGVWKESILRSFLKNKIPANIKIGTGFIITKKGPTTQIDVLIYKSDSPVFFKDGDLVIIPPDAVKGVIEVKTKLTSSNINGAIKKLSNIGRKINYDSNEYTNLLLGLFAYDSDINNNLVLDKLNENNDSGKQVIDIVGNGNFKFIKYWDNDPNGLSITYHKWHSYMLNNLAYGYFIHNILLHLSPDIIAKDEKSWFPSDINRKENFKEDTRDCVHPK